MHDDIALLGWYAVRLDPLLTGLLSNEAYRLATQRIASQMVAENYSDVIVEKIVR